ncbi:unnamed protein product [Angiostrongylus costaricensis]|uniref:DUF2013 domain-containing protein n=1 Tax=Angiostrongylus costaricensis TaxID=334426 RepID=A0A0R3PJ19_ANGCS|nr:unnamed protein product [Angiostrongylus costaricensis]
MYERVLDERQVAKTTVDAIRSTTDAHLYSCIEAARNFMAVIAPFIQLCKAYFPYGVEFISIQMKTDSKISMHVVSMDDFKWLSHLINVYQMDQNSAVRRAGLNCIASLTDACPDLIAFLLNSRLPEVLASEFQTQDFELTNLHLLAIQLLTKIYSTDKAPPLQHFDFFDINFFTKLTKHLRDHPNEIMDFIVNFNFLCPETHENRVINALEVSPCSLLGQLLVKSVNEEITDRRLKFFLDTSKGELYKQLFYENDLNVLSHVLARELVNSESKKIRRRCMECIVRLSDMGYCDRMILEAIESSDFKDALYPETLKFIERTFRDM